MPGPNVVSTPQKWASRDGNKVRPRVAVAQALHINEKHPGVFVAIIRDSEGKFIEEVELWTPRTPGETVFMSIVFERDDAAYEKDNADWQRQRDLARNARETEQRQEEGFE